MAKASYRHKGNNGPRLICYISDGYGPEYRTLIEINNTCVPLREKSQRIYSISFKDTALTLKWVS